MQCPLCLETALDERFHSGIEIDVCPRCNGIWLDRGELEKLARAPAEASARPGDTGNRDSDRSASAGSDAKGPSKKKRKKSLGSRLGDVLDEILDLG